MNKKTPSKIDNRNSNIEVLRIISMLMIIGHHLVLYGVQQKYDSTISGMVYNQGTEINRFFVQLLLPGGIVGVAIFFMIMGYFGVKSDDVKIASVVRMTFIYSILCLVFYVVLDLFKLSSANCSLTDVLCSFIPICSSRYWFITTYVVLSLIKPVINNYIKANGYFVFFASFRVLCIS